MRDAWKGLETLAWQTKPKFNNSNKLGDKQKERSDELNDFYCRFDSQDFRTELAQIRSELQEKMVDDVDFEMEAKIVEGIFLKLNTRKAIGPDNICGRLLKSCASQLSVVFSPLYTWSLKENTIPFTWKSSVICPVPKKQNPCLNDYRPITLTSIVMKCFERIILHQLMKRTKPHLDQYQFAYNHNRSTKDATLTLLHNAYTHLEKPGSFLWILFIDFSSAFNTIQPHLVVSKLLKLDVNPRLILWIVNFLVNRSQTKLYSCLPALFPPALHKALSYFLFFLRSMQMTAQALTQHLS